MSCRLLVALLLALTLAPWTGSRALGDPRISEFMASNSRVLKDEDQSYEDWIEIENPDTAPVSLEGWYLTDSASTLARWRFPATNLPPRSYLVVFASAKDRTTPGAPLHTNFRLAASGGYLALVRPDGLTVATEFAPQYPPQVPNISYGYPLVATNLALVPTNAAGRLLVPGPATDLSTWAAPGFDDTPWQTVTNGVGFGGTVAQADYGLAVLATAPVGYWRLNELAGVPAALNLGSGAALDGNYLGGVTTGTAGPRPAATVSIKQEKNESVRRPAMARGSACRASSSARVADGGLVKRTAWRG
jgi:hypothetical protein